MNRQIAGAPGRTGLAEAEERRRAWEDRPLPWWDADGHARQRAELGLPPLESTDD